MNKEKSLEQFKKNINLMFENNDKEIYLNKDDALKIEYYIYSLEQQVKKQKEVINRIFNETKETEDICIEKETINIFNLLKENQELKSQLKGTTHCFDEEEHRKLENNWNELKRWLYEDHCLYVPEIARNSTYQKVLEKMYEIEKESNSNEI